MVSRLPEQEELSALTAKARARLAEVVDSLSATLKDLYTGRDPGLSSLLGPQFRSDRVAAPWSYPDIAANFLQSRLRQLREDTIPELPSFLVEAVLPEATQYAEDQAVLANWSSRYGGLKKAMRDATMYGPMGTHFGVRLWTDTSAPLHERFKYEAVPAEFCGFEPGLKRFTWHEYTESVPDEPQQTKVVTEVFWAAGEDCWAYRYEKNASQEQQRDKDNPLGQFIGRTKLKGQCPLVLGANLDPAPGEDIAPPECASWVPLIRAIHAVLDAIDREVGNINQIMLHDADIDAEDIDSITENRTGNTVFIPIKNLMDDPNGVSHKMRPVERQSALNELVGTFQLYLQVLDDIIGVSALDRGQAVGPRKSAAEASILAGASSQRTRDRLSVLAEMLARIKQVEFTWQREIYGNEVKIPLPGIASRTIPIPEAAKAQMSFKVDVVEMGNLSKQGQIETYAAATQIVGSTLAQFQGAPPPAVNAALKGYLKSIGANDVAFFLERPVAEGGPQERYIAYLQRPSLGIITDPADPPEPFLAYYAKVSKQAATEGADPKLLIELRRAMSFYERQASEAATQQAPQQGINPLGAPQSALPSTDIPLT